MPAWWHAVVAQRPWWVALAMFVAVISGLLASLLMLLRKPFVFHLFSLALATTLISVGHASLVVMDPAIEASFQQVLQALVGSIVVGAFMVGYSKWAQKNHYLP